MKILLTGASGFIGSCYLRKLNELGIDHVYIVDTAALPSNNPNLAKKKFKDYFSHRELLSRVEIGTAPAVEAVFHLGACADTTEMDRAYLKQNNLEYSQTLAKWALGRNSVFHYASSASVYGDGKQGYSDAVSELGKFSPLNPYAESKWLFDRWVIDQGLVSKVVGYRYFNVFGPNEYHKGDMKSMVTKAFNQIKEKGAARLFASSRPGYTDGSEERDFVYVKDVNDVMVYFLEHPDKKGIFNLGTGKARSFKDLVTAVFTALGKKPLIDYFPMPEKLKGQYQYFTEADLANLRAAGYKKPFMELEASVGDYVKKHLTQENIYY